MKPSSRRNFARQLAGAALAATLAPSVRSETKAAVPRNRIHAFSKAFRTLGFEEAASLCAEVGWDGLEVPVRARDSHIELSRAHEDLPRFVAALQKRGREIGQITTDITRVTPDAEKLLRLAARLGIPTYRLGFQHYNPDRPIPAQLAEIGAALRDVAAMNREIGIQGGIQNHSGARNVGAPVWDLWTLLRDVAPRQLGVCFDIGHATLEGGLSWPTQSQLIRPHLAAVYVKDFRWEKTDKGWHDHWCPLGEGAVQPRFFTWLLQSGYEGPIVQHHEYDTLGAGTDRLRNFKADLAVLRRWLGAAA